jgi:hypothetical protein
MIDIVCPITVKETAGLHRIKEPVRIGIPFPRKSVQDPHALHLLAGDGTQCAFQALTLEYWADKSVKWALFDFFATLQANTETTYTLTAAKPTAPLPSTIAEKISIKNENGVLRIDTQAAIFTLASQGKIFDSVTVAGEELLDPAAAQLTLQDVNGNLLTVEQSPPEVEEGGAQRCSIVRRGVLKDTKSKCSVHCTMRYSFWAGLSTVRIDCTLHNPQAALHPGGLWDLGDKGSVYFKDFTVQLALPGLAGEQHTTMWQAEPAEEKAAGQYTHLTLHQNSSGGTNWDSPNHLNCHGEKTVSFQGYQITATGPEGQSTRGNGLQATPWMKIANASSWIGGTIENFWQNFPNSLRTSCNILQLSIFPEEQQQPFELQGGEQKRHTLFLDFGLNGNEPRINNFQQPLQVLLSPEWLEKSAAIAYFSASDGSNYQQYQEYIQHIIEGENSFFNKRETIDEYGWRNFGDTYADHEAVNHTGPEPFISHYNNQYDFIYGACFHFLRSGNTKWWNLAVPAALHMIDIDIYRTDQDKAAYNGGLFWHTDHYQQAKTATHRAYSVKNKTSSAYGGGTSNEHIYSSGLTLYYFLTGDTAAKEAVLLLANYVLDMDDGSKTVFALFDEGPSGLASQTVDVAFHHPGRGPGNCINCLLDAYRLSNQRRFLGKAEELIQRCIHPADDIAALTLDEPEFRWSYLVFLQILGKYLDYKTELAETDYAFFYARDSLLHYAHWMAGNEVPYKKVLHKVLLPTETWPAHDIRKCHIFHVAAKYGPAQLRQPYAEKATEYFTSSLNDLLSFKTAFLTRPLVILCVYGSIHCYFNVLKQAQPYITHCYDFADPVLFIPQRLRYKTNFVKKLRLALHLAKNMVQNKISVLLSR